MKWNFLRELARKAFHLLILLVLVGFFFIEKSYGKQAALLALTGLLIIFLLLEFLRLDLKIQFAPVEFFLRPKESERMSGTIYFILSSIICLAVFDFPIALTALSMATFGDLVAALVGQKFGQTKIYNKKTIEGSIAELGCNIIIGFLLLFSTANVNVILAMALAATAVELASDLLDDNLLVPIFSGFVGQLFLFL